MIAWRTDSARRYRPAWDNHPARAGIYAPFYCQVAGCDKSSYVVVSTPDHKVVVCLSHADQLYVDHGYIFEAVVMP